MTYEETLAWLHSMPRVHTAPTLARVRALLFMAGNPQDALAGRFLHVTGTNGKGSVCAFLSTVLRRQGYRVGRFISPFIMEFRERMEIDGSQITEDEVIALGAELHTIVNRYTEETGQTPLEFELVTVMGLLWFARRACDYVVLEVGIGGTYDPTNIVSPLLSVIMRVDYDHTELLGGTLAEIAAQKAGIIKPGAPCVLYEENDAAVVDVIARKCRETGSLLVRPDLTALHIDAAKPGKIAFTYRGVPYRLRLSGIYQVRNAAAVLEALLLLPSLGVALSQDAIAEGLAETTFPARFEVISEAPLILLDGAHNASGMEALAENIRFYFNGKPLLFLCGMLCDKHPEEALSAVLGPQTDGGGAVYCACITPPSPRAMPAETLCSVFRGAGISADAYADIRVALDALCEMRRQLLTDKDGEEAADDYPILCFGSLYSAGDIRRACGLLCESDTADV